MSLHRAAKAAMRHGVQATCSLSMVALTLCRFAPLAHAFGNEQAGTSGAAFLKIGPGARPVAMGEAFTGVADDIHAVYWNPAGLATIRSPELTAMHMAYFGDIQYEYAAFGFPTERRGTWGLSISNLHTDSIDRRTEDTDVADGQFKASDSAYGLNYGLRVADRLALGASAKLIRQSLDSAGANTFASDLGALYDVGWRGVRTGLAIQNLGTKVKFHEESDPLPLTFRLGASAPFLEERLRLASDLIIPRDNQVGLAIGGEYRKRLSSRLTAAVRSGYRTDSDVDGLSGLSAGGGLTFGRAGVDFAWVPFGDLGNAYRFSLHLRFGRIDEEDGEPRRLQKASLPPDNDATLEALLAL